MGAGGGEVGAGDVDIGVVGGGEALDALALLVGSGVDGDGVVSGRLTLVSEADGLDGVGTESVELTARSDRPAGGLLVIGLSLDGSGSSDWSLGGTASSPLPGGVGFFVGLPLSSFPSSSMDLFLFRFFPSLVTF